MQRIEKREFIPVDNQVSPVSITPGSEWELWRNGSYVHTFVNMANARNAAKNFMRRGYAVQLREVYIP